MQIVDFRYVRLGTRDVKAAIEFGINIIGLEHVGTENGFAYMRGDDRDHNICYFEGDPADQTIGFQVASMADLEEAIADFKEGGITVERGDENECYHRRVKAFIKFKDPGGNKLEFSVGAYSSGVRYFPGRDAGIKEMHHFGLTSTNPMSDESFWQKYMKMQVTDRIGDDVTLFTYDSAHHRGGLAKGSGPGIHHICFYVDSVDEVMKNYYYLLSKGVKIKIGPGRHATSKAIFVYFAGPDGVIYEYATGHRVVDKNALPGQYPMVGWSSCTWGSIP